MSPNPAAGRSTGQPTSPLPLASDSKAATVVHDEGAATALRTVPTEGNETVTNEAGSAVDDAATALAGGPAEGLQEPSIEQTVFGSKELLEPYLQEILERRTDPIYLIKPVALVEENVKYDYSELEDSLINFLLEKVVVMREVPFVRAIEQLERNANVNKIYD